MRPSKKGADCPVALRRTAANDVWLTRLRDPSRQNDAIGELTTLLIVSLTQVFVRRDAQVVAVEDIAQEAILKTLASLDDFRGECRFTTWAMSIAIRIGLSQMRMKLYQDVSLESLGVVGLHLEPKTHPAVAEQQHDRTIIIQRLRHLIDTKLTSLQRTCIRAQLEGMPVEVIAAKLNRNRNATYKLIHDARIRLRDGLKAAGVEADDMISAFTDDTEIH